MTRLLFRSSAIFIPWVLSCGAVGSKVVVPDAPTPGHEGPSRGTVWLPAGRFEMGSPAGESGRDVDEGPRTELAFERFEMDVTPVTTQAFAARQEQVRARDPQARWWTDAQTPGMWLGRCNLSSPRVDHPVNCVDWRAARAYCELVGGALPTEAEWEYAARASTTTAYWWGASFDAEHVVGSVACATRGCGGGTAPVVQAGARCNAWGLCDMAGNVWQWTATAYQEHLGAEGAAAPSEVPAKPVHRGGSWLNHVPSLFRSAHRGLSYPQNGLTGVGFRCVRRP
ncbi:formylglycine-generating enzyme family protein [Corallococcus llansteffanensis]|uniref:Formylglycine-generating enzyme family protein n=1 Tax=Corallococcus llansteffanensis TaxID=2316731 RepID=A0A3A8P1U7_9BACT|nr:formylglycine-generating enzyme family protein [Corallococcus llansteffanensis]RKH49769.1 formylglycine-generating enzyme family protein [Corallococcus llansteffanensis]